MAIATQGGLLSALAVLAIGTFQGGRAWIVLIRAAVAFLLCSAILKILTAGVMTWVSAKRTQIEKTDATADDIDETVGLINSISPETAEK